MGRWLIRMLIVLLILLVLAVGAAAGFYFWLNSFLKGESFRRLASQEASHALHVQGEFLPMHWSGSSVFTDGFHGTGQPGEALQEIHAEQLRADLNFRAVLDGQWRIPQITVQRVAAHLAPPQAPSPAPSSEATGEAASGPGWLEMLFAPLLPTEVVIERISIDSTEVSWQPKEGGAIRLMYLTLELTPDGKAWNILGHGGRLSLPEWPVITVPSLKLRYANDTVYVTEAQMRPQDQGSVSLSGEVATKGAQAMHLIADVKDVPVSALTEGHWIARLTGKLAGRLEWNGSLSQADGLSATGPVTLTEGRLEALPALETVAKLTKMDDFRSVRLDEARAQVDWNPQRLVVNDLVLRSDGLLWVTGSVTRTGDQLQGTVQLGTLPRILKFIPGAEKQVFTESRDGYVWTTVQISGTADSPREDLTPRLQAAALNEVIENAGDTVQGVLDKARSLLPAFFPGTRRQEPAPQPTTPSQPTTPAPGTAPNPPSP